MAIFAGQRLTASVLAALISPDTWHAATLINSWTGSSSGVNGVFYRKNSAGDVDVTGDIIKVSGTSNSVCAVLPAGYVPVTGQNFATFWNNPVGSNSATPPWVFADTSGNLNMTGIETANKEIFFSFTVRLGSL